MCPRQSVAITLPTLRALIEYHDAHPTEKDLADLADLAIRDWLVRQRGPLGYFWKSMSPNQFATASLGTVRNAWEAIFVQIPGERDWKRATGLRYLAEMQKRKAGQRG